MKKSILAIGAAAVVGGLGFAGAAHAVAIFGAGSNTTATRVLQTTGNIGHHLYTPYFTAQGDMATLFNITNTDRTNGKAVKVRFRGAANSDDVLDFTVFLSPGDVWTGSVSRDQATGHAVISTPDNSCTIPPAAEWPGLFKTSRLANYLSEEVKAANTREGYIEVLNMADIPGPFTTKGTLAYGIKHVNGVAPCDLLPYEDLLSTDVVEPSEAGDYGLAAPSGGLMGSWAVFNQARLAVYSGNQTALVATPTGGTDASLTPFHGVGKFAFAPQIEAPINNQALVDLNTADPLLRTGSTSGITPLWFDLPDMSTPLGSSYANAVAQAAELNLTLRKNAIYNDYVATGATAEVPMETDWVVSQPTRRYHAAVNYGTAASGAVIEWTTATGSAKTPETGNPYASLTINRTLAQGPQSCLSVSFSSADREEKFQTAGGGFSPGVTSPYCGEVFTVSFNGTSVLQAALTNRQVAPVGEAGWARLQVADGLHVPVVGFAATSIQNQAIGGNYGMTLPHRWYGTNWTPTPTPTP